PSERDVSCAARYQDTPNQPMAAKATTATTATARIAVRNGPPGKVRPRAVRVVAMLVMVIQSEEVEVTVTADGQGVRRRAVAYTEEVVREHQT
ncbi:MAG: hypothetical protein WAN20_16895, partial [Pseudonocardiaceae bacterium]